MILDFGSFDIICHRVHAFFTMPAALWNRYYIQLFILVILVYYYAINQVKKVLFLQHFLFFWGLLCKQFIFLMKIIRNPSFRWYELSGTHLTCFPRGSHSLDFSLFCCLCHGPMKLTLIKGSQHTLGSRFLLPLPRTQWNSFWSKAANMPLEAGFCCLRQGSNEAHFDQRQQTCLWKQVFAASVKDPMKLTLVKGSKHAFGSRVLLLLPRIQWNSLWSKAASMP